MERIDLESFWLACPLLTDELVERETLERLKSATVIVGIEEVAEMSAQLGVIVVVVAFDGGVLDRAIHSLDMTFGPRMIDLRAAILDAIFVASHVEHVRHLGGSRTIGVSRREAELDAVVDQNGVDLVGCGLDEGDQKGRCGDSVGLVDELGESKLRGDRHVKIELSFRRPHFGDGDMEEADRVCLELLLRGLVSARFGQPADPMPLKAAVQRRPRQVRDGRL